MAEPVGKINELQVGDMIRLRAGRHIAVVLEIAREAGSVKEIRYGHSSELTENPGVHSGIIRVGDPSLGLEEQDWQEKTRGGENYRQKFRPDLGDGVFKLKIWA